MLLLEPPTADAAALHQQLLDGTYPRPFVVDDGQQRFLYFNVSLMQSAMAIAAPARLELRYTQQMMAFLLFVPRPLRVWMIGLGGGSVVKFCAEKLPDTRFTVFEINPDVIALREIFCLPPDGPTLDIVEADGLSALAAAEPGIEVLLIDAFGPLGFAPGFSDPVFIGRTYEKLAAQGVMVINLAGERSSYRRLIDTVREVFDGQVLLMPVAEDGNHLLFAFRDPVFEPRWRKIHHLALEQRARFGLDFPAFAQALERAAKQRLHLAL